MTEDLEQNRLNPDDILSYITENESKTLKGKLKIFFGMCAGVGKTYAMLKAAQKLKAEGIDVAAGVVNTHGRSETGELLEGLEVIPLKTIRYRETLFLELDIDKVLNRKPAVILVDEVAHTNIPGSRHIKRYQDVLELLNNGIDVYTTLNVQHLESRSETVRNITGSTIRETVPDIFFEQADEIELIDITPDKLLERLKEGKVYTPEKSRQAIENFFRKGNLTALREMALRITAERVDKDLRDYKSEKNISDVWKSGQRLMCAIGPSPYSAELIKWTKRVAYTSEASWIAVYIEKDKKLSEKNKEILLRNFKLVQDLGGELITIQDTDIVSALIRTAKRNNVTQIVIGKSRKTLLPVVRNNFVKKLLKESGDIDVNIVGGERLERKSLLFDFRSVSRSPLWHYLICLAIVIVLSIAAYNYVDSIGPQVISLVYLLLITILPVFNFGFGPILITALFSSFILEYFLIPPRGTVHIEKPEDALMFITFFILAFVSGYLSTKVRSQKNLIRIREEKTAKLFTLSKKLSAALNRNDIAEAAVEEISNTFSSEVVIFFPESAKKISARPHSSSTFFTDDYDWAVVQWAFNSEERTGKFTSTLPNCSATYYPLKSKSGNMGVIGLRFKNDQPLPFDLEDLLEDFLVQISSSLEREYLGKIAEHAQLTEQSEKLYNTLFDSLSHELKTPITTIIGAVSSLSDNNIIENRTFLTGILNEINVASARLNRLVENLLDMTRLESGKLKLKLEWNSVSELINSVLNRFRKEFGSQFIINKIEEDQIFLFDFVFLEQALNNIIYNSCIYTPPGTEIIVQGMKFDDNYVITISDNGNGFPEEDQEKLFQKFYRIPGSKTGGTGLGLSISKGIIEAHGGKITASNRAAGGAVFTITLPIKESQ